MPAKATQSVTISKLIAARVRAVHADDLEVLRSVPMSKLIDVSWPTLRTWCEKLSEAERGDAFTFGAQGVDYKFRPVPTIDALLGHFQSRAAAKHAQDRRIVEATGIEVDEDDPGDIEDIQRRLRLTMMVSEHKQLRGEYTLTTKVQDYVRKYNQRVVEAIMGIGTKIDPTGQLPASVRSLVHEALRDVASEVASSAKAYVGELSARPD